LASFVEDGDAAPLELQVAEMAAAELDF
jgi:hypothetical protein